MRMSAADDFAIAEILQELVFSVEPASKPRAVLRQAKWDIPGFLGKTLIGTNSGEVPVRSLRVDDKVQTTSGHTLRIGHIDRINLDPNFLHCHPEAQPIHIMANAFDRGLPERNLLVSAGQELAFTIGGGPIRRAKAGDIEGNASVERAVHGALTYYILELERPAYIFAEGVAVLIPAKAPAQCDEEDEKEGHTDAVRQSDKMEIMKAQSSHHRGGKQPLCQSRSW